DDDLRESHLSGAYLRGADLSGANLSNADLSKTDLRDADLRDADLTGANLTYSDLGSTQVDPETVKVARDWEMAFYDDETLRALGLPSNHNHKLADRKKNEEALKQKRNGAERALRLIPAEE